jgi:hypothetical protein
MEKQQTKVEPAQEKQENIGELTLQAKAVRLCAEHSQCLEDDNVQGQTLDAATKRCRLQAAQLFCKGGGPFKLAEKMERVLMT